MKEPREIPPPLELEVVPPEMSAPPPGSGQGPRPAPFHAWSAILLLAVDSLWSLADFAIIDWFLTVPLCFLMVATGTFLIQRRRNRDPFGRALAKALFLGVVAAVPFSITGTPVGLALLAWAGIRHPWRKV